MNITPSLRKLAICTGLVLCNSALAEPDSRPSFLEYLKPERLVNSVIQGMLVSARTGIDLTYQSVHTDFITGQVAITGLKLYPDLPWLKGNSHCEVSAQRTLLDGNGLSDTEHYKARLDLSGIAFDKACLPPNVAPIIDTLNITPKIDRAYADITYHYGSSALTTKVNINMDNLAMINLDLDFGYFAITKAGSRRMQPVALVDSGVLIIENQGLWQSLKPMIPANLTEPEPAAETLTQTLEGFIRETNGSTAEKPVAFTEAQQQLLQSAKQNIADFIRNPGQLVVEFHPISDAWLSDDMDNQFAALVNLLKPTISRTTVQQVATLDAAQLSQAFDHPEALTTAQRLKVAAALIKGVGAPKSLSRATTLLEPMASEHPEAAYLLAEALQASQPEQAYRHSLIATKGNVDGALAQLNQLENRLPTETVLKIQDSLLKNQPLQSLANLRNKAFAYLMGTGESRSYSRAWLLASLAAAAGDSASLAVREEIDQRMMNRGQAVADLWQQRTDGLSEQAMEYWLEHNLSKALQP